MRLYLNPHGTDIRKGSAFVWLARWCLAALVCGLFVTACLLPAVRTYGSGLPFDADTYSEHTGFDALWQGWVGPFFICWAANPLLLVALVLLLRGFDRFAWRLMLPAAVLAASLLLFMRPNRPWEPSSGLAVTRVSPGYYLWLASHLTLLLGAAALDRWGGEEDATPQSATPDGIGDAAPREAASESLTGQVGDVQGRKP